MGILQIMFWILSALAIGSAVTVITTKNPVYSVLALIVTFFAISGLYILMNAQFLAIVNIIVYAGAIMVLFLFVVMLMNLNKESEPMGKRWVLLLGVLGGGVLLLVLVMAINDITIKNKAIDLSGGEIGLIKNLGMKLFKDYVIPFEISSVLFLSAIVGAVVLAKREKQPAQ
jgi:NADH-quinone oxidoreductase subunit J